MREQKKFLFIVLFPFSATDFLGLPHWSYAIRVNCITWLYAKPNLRGKGASVKPGGFTDAYQPQCTSECERSNPDRMRIISVNRPRDILKISEFSSVSVSHCSAWILCRLFVHWMNTRWMESLDSLYLLLYLSVYFVSMQCDVGHLSESFQCPMSPITHVKCETYVHPHSFFLWNVVHTHVHTFFCSQRLYVSGYQHIPSLGTRYVYCISSLAWSMSVVFVTVRCHVSQHKFLVVACSWVSSWVDMCSSDRPYQE